MKRILLPLIAALAFPNVNANAGVYYYLNYSDKGSIKIKCANGKANHLVDSRSGITVQLKGHGGSKYKYPVMSMDFPYGRWANSKNKMCVFKYLDDDQHKNIEIQSVRRCIENKKFCSISKMKLF